MFHCQSNYIIELQIIKLIDIRSVYPDDDNVTLNTVANIGKDFSTGSEMMMIFDPLEFWNLNFMANLYNYRIEGVLYDESFERESFNWSTRLNNMFKTWSQIHNCS